MELGTSRREIRAVALGAGLVFAYTALVLLSDKVKPAEFGGLLVLYLKGSFALWQFVALFALATMLFTRRPRDGRIESALVSTRRWVVERWRRDRMLSLIWPPLLFALLMAAFNTFKQLILRDSTFAFDPLFFALDRALFHGVDPWRITHELFPSPWVTYVIDTLYHSWFVPMSLGVIICAFLPGATWRLRCQYQLSYIAVWVLIGSFLAYLMPAAGPTFYDEFVGSSALYDPLMTRLAADEAWLAQAMSGTNLSALAYQSALLDIHGSRLLTMGGGISAMPSVHNALAVLFAIAAFRIHAAAGWTMAVYAVLIWIGSFHLGWHYAIDGVAAALLTLGIWWVAGKVTDWLEGSVQPETLSRNPLAEARSG